MREYRFPVDLASYLFWQAYSAGSLEIDCQNVGIRNEQDLLEICTAEQAATHLSQLVVNGGRAAATEDLGSVTVSVGKLCKQLRKVNGSFTYSFINADTADPGDEAEFKSASDKKIKSQAMSTVKLQRQFCENQLSDMMDWSR